MKNRSISRALLTVTPIVIACVLFTSAISAFAQSEDAGASRVAEHCSNRTLHGDYGCSVRGFLVNNPGLPPEATFVAVTTSHFDGKGNVTGTEHAVVNGMSFRPGFDTNSGTYSVNANCTGTSVVNTPNSPVPLNLYFVIVDNGEEFFEVLSTHALSTVCKKIRSGHESGHDR